MEIDTVKVARPHLIRAALAGIATIAGIVLASYGDIRGSEVDALIAGGGALLVLVAGVVAVRSLAGAVRAAAGEAAGDARAGVLGLVVTVLGYAIVVIAVLSALRIDVRGLLLGGAITGVVVGIAAQQTLGNFFAGVVLLLVRPFTVGDHIVLRSGPLNGEYEGDVTEMGLFYVKMETERGRVDLPNSGVLSAAIGPGARTATDEPEGEEDPTTSVNP